MTFIDIGQYLKELRRDNGISQSSLAKTLNITTVQQISNVERGVSGPPLKCIKEWCRIVKADPNQVRLMLIHIKIQGIERAFR